MLHYPTVVLQDFVDLEPQRYAKVCLHSKIIFQMRYAESCFETKTIDDSLEIVLI